MLTRKAEQAALAVAPSLRTAREAMRAYGRFALPLAHRLVALAEEGPDREHVRELAQLLEQDF